PVTQHLALYSALAHTQLSSLSLHDALPILLNDNFHQTWESLLRSTSVPEEEFWHEATRAVPNFIWIAEAYSDSEWALQQLGFNRSEEHTSELQSPYDLVCRLLLEKKNRMSP